MKYYLLPGNEILAALRDNLIGFHDIANPTGFENQCISAGEDFTTGLADFINDYDRNGYFSAVMDDDTPSDPSTLPIYTADLPCSKLLRSLYLLPDGWTPPDNWTEFVPLKHK